ncbi:hypothetical protein D187_004119 [Cystobacter fuscus DSM 2262]|uniref:Uncharacterized protein n=1 Tax=Cystobacter fuscus (strain ATCC 25194 / DSM 2262 / NBRC 100088 / M29) TaxID=1242864 RepID=S9QP62_CYSF2|nr:hypothetical protein D187_004119 [Cystobacter fuscus DSM 2262]
MVHTPPFLLLPHAGKEGASAAPEAVVSKEPKKERMPRVDWAKLLRRRFALAVSRSQILERNNDHGPSANKRGSK